MQYYWMNNVVSLLDRNVQQMIIYTWRFNHVTKSKSNHNDNSIVRAYFINPEEDTVWKSTLQSRRGHCLKVNFKSVNSLLNIARFAQGHCLLIRSCMNSSPLVGASLKGTSAKSFPEYYVHNIYSHQGLGLNSWFLSTPRKCFINDFQL